MEEWTQWIPIQDLSGKYYIDSFGMVGDDWDLVIMLSNYDKTQKIEIRFDSFVASYKYTNESFCFAIFGELSEKYGDDFYTKWSFFKINNSDYVKWLIAKSYDSDFIHFCILGGDEILDIVAFCGPKVNIIKK